VATTEMIDLTAWDMLGKRAESGRPPLLGLGKQSVI